MKRTLLLIICCIAAFFSFAKDTTDKKVNIKKIASLQSPPFFKNGGLSTNAILVRVTSYANIITKNGINKEDSAMPYTLGHMLYIPMLYAYNTNNQPLIAAFTKLFSYQNLKSVQSSIILNDLNKTVFYYVAAENLRNAGIKTDDNRNQFNLLKNEVLAYWKIKSGKNWSEEKNNSVGARMRINNILAHKDNGNMSFYNAITDNELYIMTIAASLGVTERQETGSVSPELQDICDTFMKVAKQLVVFNADGTWFLQPNVWKDHRDFKNVILAKGQSVNWDVSHFSRMPGFLYVYGLYFNQGSQSDYINRLKQGLSKIFVTRVAKYNANNNAYTFSNYIDGNNSSFRIGYRPGFAGYSPGGNITNVFWAWWKLLNTPEIQGMYDRINANFIFYKTDQNVNRFAEFYKEVCSLK